MENMERLGATGGGQNAAVTEEGLCPTGVMKWNGVPARPWRAGEYVNAEILMWLAWENPVLTEDDCALLFRLIKDAQAEEARRKIG